MSTAAEIGIAERIVTPEGCTLLFGVPIDREGFLRDLRNDRGRDFVRSHPRWDRYSQQVVAPAQQLVRRARSLGVDVITDATLDDFAKAFRDDRDAVILVSHWLGDTVELTDAMHDIDTVVACIPIEFDGIVDLCVCTATTLAHAVRRRRVSTLVRYAPIFAWPPIWFGYFEALFTRLSEGGITYLEATSEVKIRFMSATGEPS